VAAVKVEIRSGAYHDSVVLMQLQRSLAEKPGVLDAGVVMGTDANKEILAQNDLLPPEAKVAAADDLVVVVKAKTEATATAALAEVDGLLTRKRVTDDMEYLPKSVETAADMLPAGVWVLVSVPGRYAADVARQALRLDKNVFLYSDNVSLSDETALKRTAADKGVLVMGPDCGTAIVNGVGLGFANRVRRGPIGIVAASGTGLQQVSTRIHQLGSGITHALGTGGRDLSEAVGAVTARQGLDLLNRDSETKVIVLVSKPPSPQVANQLLGIASSADKPVVVDFIGYSSGASEIHRGNLHLTTTLDNAADLAVQLAASTPSAESASDRSTGRSRRDLNLERFAPGQRFLRGLFSGGTLAYEALLIMQDYLPTVYSNIPLNQDYRVSNSMISRAHTIIDLGEDEFTVGRLHPMMDNDLRVRRLRQEADDPEVAVILLDVVLGYGAHPDPASELAPAIAGARAGAEAGGRHLEVIAVVVGTDEDPQGLNVQVQQLEAAGAQVETSNENAVHLVGQLLKALNARHLPKSSQVQVSPMQVSPMPNTLYAIPNIQQVDLAVLRQPVAAINVGLESFAQSLMAQDVPVIHVDWRPPAGGDEKLMAILKRMRS
jgi:FdrA protein